MNLWEKITQKGLKYKDSTTPSDAGSQITAGWESSLQKSYDTKMLHLILG